jgi:hypothetical protein
MRLCVVAFLFLFQLTQQSNPTIPSTKTSIEKRDAEQKTTDPKQIKTDTPTVASGSTVETPHSCDKQNNPYDAGKDTLYRAYLWATVIGVLGAIGGVVVLICQIKLLRKSADAARDAAIAAKTSSQAIINSERPWLFIEIKASETNQAIMGEVPQKVMFWISFKNWGKTPAELVGYDYHIDCLDNNITLPTPPEYTDEGRVLAHTRIIPQGELWRYPGIGESTIWAEDHFTSEQWTEIRSSRMRLVYWGRIQYRDLIEESKTIHATKNIGTIHETCFCYFWSPAMNEFLICGPPRYNQHT